LFAGRILSFDLACTHAYAELIAQSRAAGFTITTADGFIASIAIANKLIIASRDTAPFYAADAEVIHPWK
jgi:toxin FitB